MKVVFFIISSISLAYVMYAADTCQSQKRFLTQEQATALNIQWNVNLASKVSTILSESSILEKMSEFSDLKQHVKDRQQTFSNYYQIKYRDGSVLNHMKLDTWRFILEFPQTTQALVFDLNGKFLNNITINDPSLVSQFSAPTNICAPLVLPYIVSQEQYEDVCAILFKRGLLSKTYNL